MAIRNGQPVRFTAKGICDAFDATDAFPGACALLQNLVFDQGNPEVVVSRPGVGTALTTFAGFTSPTFVSVHAAVGTTIYGMVSTGRTAGFDEPFAYNTATNSFITISGVTAANVPASPARSGTWTPPTMAVVSTKVLITHPGFSGVGTNFFGVIDISNPAAPVWSSSNMATNPLPSVPTAVGNFNNRAYFVNGNVLNYSDVLVPLTRTNATNAVTVGDTSPITALSGMPISTLSAGMIGGLAIFKMTQIWQLTGDTTTSNLALSYITLTTGCPSPRSIIQGQFGIMFIGLDAPYVLSFTLVLSTLSNTPGQGGNPDIQVPFQNATFPTRTAGAFSGNIYRVCVPTVVQGANQTNDYWYDARRKRWNGPHTFTYDCASQVSDYFILSGTDHGAALYLSQGIPNQNSVYTDAGVPLTSHLKSSSFPKTGHMAMVQVVESTQELSSSGALVQYGITALDGKYNTLNSTFVTTQGNGAVWGAAQWGMFNWSSNANIPQVYNVPWSVPLVFQKMSLDITATSSSSVSMGSFFARYQDAGYTNQG